MNNKGFTLVEVIAAVAILGVVMTIGVYSVVNYLSAGKEKSLDIFKENIKSGMINYYNECKYLSTGVCSSGNIQEVKDENDNDTVIGYKLSTTVGNLVEYGFLDSNDSSYGIKDPITEEDISNCNISITYDKTKKDFESVTYSGNCGSLNND